MEIDKQLKFESHKLSMQVEFISNNVGVKTHDCLYSVALTLQYFVCNVSICTVVHLHCGDFTMTGAQKPVRRYN